MSSLFEKQDSLDSPIETFIFDTEKQDFPVKQHWHYFTEFIYLLKGRAEITCDEKTYIVSEGELIIFYPSSVHSIYSTDGSPILFAGIKFDSTKFQNTSSYVPSVIAILRYARSEKMQIHFNAEQAEMLHSREIFSDCIRETGQYLYGRDIMLRTHIYKLILGIVRHWISIGLDINNCPISSTEIYGIENIAEYIDSRLEENIRVADIAEKCHMSYSGFAAKFREQYGMSCKEYIELMRIFKAQEYLLFTDHDLAFISLQTGFSDSSHFIRCFKKHIGLTPKQFRLNKKQPH
ncbi:MAG: AraC family transcriptional regulator [Lachnospiraceae bacterium]|nr:AraC family transcriptional regulator [Lachnospiraceae bacterium]